MEPGVPLTLPLLTAYPFGRSDAVKTKETSLKDQIFFRFHQTARGSNPGGATHTSPHDGTPQLAMQTLLLPFFSPHYLKGSSSITFETIFSEERTRGLLYLPTSAVARTCRLFLYFCMWVRTLDRHHFLVIGGFRHGDHGPGVRLSAKTRVRATQVTKGRKYPRRVLETK